MDNNNGQNMKKRAMLGSGYWEYADDFEAYEN